MNETDLEWNHIADYDETIYTDSGNYRKRFELFVSQSGQEVAWSPRKVGHEPHINPQGVLASNVAEIDVGKVLSDMTLFELKKPVDPIMMISANRGLVERIIQDFRNYGTKH